MTRKGYPLDRCANNGCDAPPKPPSLVFCGACMDRISARMEEMWQRYLARLSPEERAAAIREMEELG